MKTYKTESKVLNIVENNDKYIITMGNYQLSPEEFDSLKDAEEYLATKPYDMLINLMCIVNDIQNNKLKK